MAKITVDVSEFEKVCEHIIKEENGPDWKLAKSFEHTTVYQKTDNDAIFKGGGVPAILCHICRFVFVGLWNP